MKLQRWLKSTEFYVGLFILILMCAIEFKSNQFFAGNNLVDLVRALCIPAMFCIGEMFVLITRGVDISFPAIASLSMYIVCAPLGNELGEPIVFFLVAMGIGLLIGLFNGLVIAYYKFNSLIVTLATSSICFGVMQGVFHSKEYPLAQPLYEFAQVTLFSVRNEASGLTSTMPVAVIFALVVIGLGWFILNKTMIGRGIYAIGGDAKAAERAGFNVFAITVFVYTFSGAMAGIIGVLRATMLMAVHPNNLEGIELLIIAACVLGGVQMTGGKGTVLGAMLGIALLTIVDNSLILLGISMVWQKVFIGMIIIVGTAASALQSKRAERRLSVQVSEKGA